MNADNNKITVRQTITIFMVSTLSAAIRLFPTDCAKISGQAAWLAPLYAAPPLLLLFYLLSSMFKKSGVNNLGEAFELSLGKAAGKALLALYLLWMIILYLLYIRYYSERLLSTIFPNTDIRFFMLVMMLLIFMSARGRLEVFARFTELAFLIFTVIMALFFLLLIPGIKAENLLPITFFDLLPSAKAAYPILGIWGYIILLFFFGNDILNKDQVRNLAIKSTIFLAATNILIIATVVGSIGPKVVERMPIPFFSAIKTISLMETFDRMESILLSVWIVSDFIVITTFAFIISHILKQLFSTRETKYLASPLAFLGYSGSQFLAPNRFELAVFSSRIGLLINIITCYAIPFIIFAVGKIRRKL